MAGGIGASDARAQDLKPELALLSQTLSRCFKMLAARLLRSRVVVAPAVALGARLASGSAADRLVDLAAAGEGRCAWVW